MSITDLSKRFAELKAQHKEAAEVVSKINAEWEAVEAQLLDAMVEDGVNQVRIAEVGLFSMRVKNFLSVAKENEERFYEYLRKSGNGGLFKETVASNTLKAFLEEHIKEIAASYTDVDEVEARNKALEFLKSVGANYFTDRGISFRAS